MKELPVIVVQLVHIQGPLMGQIQEFTEPQITIGRNPSCSVQFPTDLATVSRTHAELVREGNRYKVVDRSTNGTFVNGKRVSEAFLKDGDVIMFTEGGPKMSFLARITDEVQAAPASAPQVQEMPPAAGQAQGAPPAPPERPVPPVETAPPAAPRERPAPVHEPPKPAEQPRQSVQKVQAPLIVQFGPTIRTYKELPIVIGKKADSDFVLNHPALSDHHAQIFFSQNMYWIKDLSGRSLIAIGSSRIGFEAPLKAQDVISLAPGGPALRFLGEGRLAEYEEAPAEESPVPAKPARSERAGKEKPSKSIFDIFKK